RSRPAIVAPTVNHRGTSPRRGATRRLDRIRSDRMAGWSPMARLHVTRSDAIAFRVARHQLDRAPRSTAPTDVDLLDLGVQDTGTGGSAWALEIRGAQPTE